MFYYYPDNYRWSSAVNLALMSGGELGEINRWLKDLKDDGEGSDAEGWAEAWANMAHQQEELAAAELEAGYRASAGARYLRASVYHASGERQIEPGPAKAESYSAHLQAFAAAIEHGDLPLERIDVDSPDGPLPGYLIHGHKPAGSANGNGNGAGNGADHAPQPVVIFFGGFDVTKELLYCFVTDTFAKLGITCLVMDSPGVGEPLRLRNVASRPDYEVSAGAIIDHLETRDDLDATRVGVMGISLGGYYAPRSATYEPRIKACAAWGGIWDWGKTWEHRWGTRSRTVSVPWFQLPWVMGTDTMEEGLERVKQWSLVDVLPELSVPFLMLHGENDRQIPIAEALAAFEAAGSADKELRVFTVETGGAEHCPTDEPDPARRSIGAWFATRLAPATAAE
jgi:dienelactone hydrolase